MASQGPLSPSTAANNTSGDIGFNNVTNVFASDNVYASVTLSGVSNITHDLKATNFGFSIPSGATINGILVEMERKYVTSAAGDLSAKIIKAGTIVGASKAIGGDWPTTDTYASYGGAADLWGQTWSDTDINNSGFGFAISAIGNGPLGAGNPMIDHIRITVTYTPSGPIDYPLTAAQGSFTLTGQTTNFPYGRTILASTGIFSLTGFIVNLLSSGYTYVVKSVSSYVNSTKDSSNYSNTPKNTSVVTNQNKNTSTFANQVKNTDTFTNQTKH